MSRRTLRKYNRGKQREKRPGMISVVICEDNPVEASNLQSVVEEVARERALSIDVHTFARGDKLLMNFCRGEFDLAFVDIVLGDGPNGIETARSLRAEDEALPIVFVTSSAEYALDGYDVQALHYLMKPATKDQLHLVFDRAGSAFQKSHKSIELTSNRTTERVLVRDIVYAEVFGNRSIVHLARTAFETYTPLARLLDEADDSLLRCHRSFVVNMNHVAAVRGREFIMDNGDHVPIRINGSTRVLEQYRAFLSEGLRDE